MKKLKNQGFSSKEISDFFCKNDIRTVRTNELYTPKLIWVSLKKYEKRLSRIDNNRLIKISESLYVIPTSKVD